MKTLLRHLSAAALLASQSALHAATATIQFASANYETTELSYGLGLPFLTTPRETVWRRDDLKVTVIGGTAELGKDFSFEPIGWMSPEEGETALRMGSRISVMDDGLPEGDETVVLELSLAKPIDGLEIGPISRTTITIHNSPPTVGWWSTQFVTEWNKADGPTPNQRDLLARGIATETDALPSNQFTLFRRGDTNVAFTVEFAVGSGATATPGQDFLLPATVSFGPGETEKAVPITILDDGECELNEIISLTLRCSNPAVVLQPVSLALVDNEIPPTIDFNIRSESLPAHAAIAGLTSPLPDGGLIALVGESLSPSNRLARFDTSLKLVRLFPLFQLSPAYDLRAGQGGTILKSVHALPDGGFLISGVFAAVNGVTRPGLARFSADGSLDQDFLPLGEKPGLTPPDVIPGFRVLAALRDGRIVVQHGEETPDFAGTWSRLLRLLPNGAADPSFNPAELNSNLADPVSYVWEHEKSALLVAMAQSRRLLRLREDGTLDRNFKPPYETVASQGHLGGQLFYVPFPRGVLVQPDGRIITHFITAIDSSGRWETRLLRLHADGSVDGSFQAAVSGEPVSIASLGDVLVRHPVGGTIDWRLLDPSGAARPGHQSAREGHACVATSSDLYAAITPDLVAWGSSYKTGNGIARGVVLRLAGAPRSGFRVFGFVGSDCPAESIDPWNAVAEATGGTIEVEVWRLGETIEAGGVRYRMRDGSARAGRHFVAAEGRIEFAPLEIKKRLTLQILGGESTSREFELELTDAIGGETLGPPLRVTILGRKSGFPPGVIETLSDGTRRVTADIVHPEPVPRLSDTALERWDLETSGDLLRWTPVSKLGWRTAFVGPRPEGLPDGDGRRQHIRAIWFDLDAATASHHYYRLHYTP